MIDLEKTCGDCKFFEPDYLKSNGGWDCEGYWLGDEESECRHPDKFKEKDRD